MNFERRWHCAKWVVALHRRSNRFKPDNLNSFVVYEYIYSKTLIIPKFHSHRTRAFATFRSKVTISLTHYLKLILFKVCKFKHPRLVIRWYQSKYLAPASPDSWPLTSSERNDELLPISYSRSTRSDCSAQPRWPRIDSVSSGHSDASNANCIDVIALNCMIWVYCHAEFNIIIITFDCIDCATSFRTTLFAAFETTIFANEQIFFF